MGPDPDPSQSGVRPSPDELTDPNGNPLATNQRTPGKGNLAVLPDSDELVPMTPEDAEAYLRQAVERILGERREYQQQAARSTSRDVLDW